MKKVSMLFVLMLCFTMLTGCAAVSRFDINKGIQSAAIAGLDAVLKNNPSHKADVCKDFTALTDALAADCCWDTYLLQINSTFTPKYSGYAAIVINMLNDDAPILGMVNMSDTDKANIKKDLAAVVAGIGCTSTAPVVPVTTP